MKAKKESLRLVLEDYRSIGNYVMDALASDDLLVRKIQKKINDLANPKPRQKPQRAKYICEKCDHKFKRVVAKCPKCEDTNIKKLDDYFEEE